MQIVADLRLLGAAIFVIAGIGGALILSGLWARLAALVLGLLVAAYIAGYLPAIPSIHL